MNVFTKAVFVCLISSLASCSDKAPVSSKPATAKVAESIRLDGDLVVDLSATPERLVTNSTIKVSPIVDGVRVSGTKAEASSGSRTGGAYIEIGSVLESAFANNTIRVSVLARSPEEGGMKVAYSTADKGNSGWQSFSLTQDFATYEFDYRVPSVIAGRNDYIGILPLSSSVEVSFVAVSVLEP